MQLDRVLAEVDRVADHPELGPEVANTLPTMWNVSYGEKTFAVPTEWLRSELQNAKNANGDSVRKVRERLRAMRTEAEAFRLPPAESSAERAAINEILARGEFRDVHGPTWWEHMRRRIFEWLVLLLSRIFGSSAFPTVTRGFVWTVVVSAVLFAGWAVFRAIRQNAGLESIVIDAEPISARVWTAWMADARAAAAQGDWREAIHMAYWSGISMLEAGGLWRPDRARTPREYLRLLPSQSQHYSALTALTRRFEEVWYGYSSADESAYLQTLAELEKLGCR